jgi:septal ring factor EnvC (AmiA/AmiB activator)
MRGRTLSLFLLGPLLALAGPALAAEPPAAAAGTADLQQQMADAQDKLATALHSYALLDDANTRLKAEVQPLQERARQLQNEVAALSAENERLRTRLALLAPLPGSPAAPQRAPAPAQAP